MSNISELIEVIDQQVKKTKRGLYVAIEGIDGSGKSSVISLLSKVFYKANLSFSRLPGGSPFAEEHRNACRGADIDPATQVLFYGALIRDASVSGIERDLSEGRTVICDRSWISTLVYQALPSSNERLLLSIVEDEAIPMPDLVIYLNIPMATSIEREQARVNAQIETGELLSPDDRYSKFAREQKEIIKEGYDIFFKLPPETGHYAAKDEKLRQRDDFALMWKLQSRLCKSVSVIDADRPFQEVFDDVCEAIFKHKHLKDA